ncbi:hypothetical protein CHAB381_0805 [Campylobacter hominis ATCC BAA-381]|uniref:Uncharacterized protein n=1 Tax=Campylobacter hominis (strain ATCC BAA-381 / DSM 21671 / CCUG 45161 / LMG 19568 / NCTC 13146 / CH001A) TaxID=360107 RepID=A7I1I2_CAMHC|nr:hypothetical protein CHAB381_0805 [Campylobacter hominis ATCC BAA-381]
MVIIRILTYLLLKNFNFSNIFYNQFRYFCITKISIKVTNDKDKKFISKIFLTINKTLFQIYF